MRHLQVLRYIEKIARAGSLRSAAEELGITPSALNRRVLGIEAELGVEIFERHPAGLRPNIAGEILLEHIRNQLADMERVKSRIADLSGMRAGHINIAATRELVQYFLPALIQRHLEEFPAVTFRVNLCQRGEAELSLADHSNDVAIVFEPMRLNELHTACVVGQQMFCIMAANHPLAGRADVSIYDCTGYPLLLPTRQEGIRAMLDSVAAKVGLTLEPALESNSLDLLRLMSRDSLSLSFALEVNLRPELERDGLVSVPLKLQGVAPGALIAGYQRGRTLPVAAARFLEGVGRELSERFG